MLATASPSAGGLNAGSIRASAFLRHSTFGISLANTEPRETESLRQGEQCALAKCYQINKENKVRFGDGAESPSRTGTARETRVLPDYPVGMWSLYLCQRNNTSSAPSMETIMPAG
jgi:hypothetical protein